ALHHVTSGGFVAAGWACDDFADNSVTCHAYRRSESTAYGRQSTFVSGSGLALATKVIDEFFPNVYNEDWMYLVRPLRRSGVSYLGNLIQDEYFPFVYPQLAARQE